MKNILIALSYIIFCGSLTAQTTQIQLLHKNSLEEIEGATVFNLNTNGINISDESGKFQVNTASLPVKLQITALGYQDYILTISEEKQEVTVYMTPVSQELSEVIIRSGLIPNSLRKSPASISIISQNDFERNDPTNLAQVFNNVPGMYVNQGALNTTKIAIRGIGARSQYSTNRIQTYFDGIPLTTAEGESTIDDIDQESLDRIEVIKGPTSSIYGAGLGGVINLYSATPEQEQTIGSIRSQIGSFNTQKHTISAGHSTQNSHIYANYTNLESDGYRNNGNYSRQSMLVNAKLITNDLNSLSFLANFTRLKAFIPSSINEENFINNPRMADANWEASQGFESYDRGLIGLSYNHTINSNFTNVTSIFLSFRDAYEPRPFDILKEERVSAGARTRFNLKYELFNVPAELSFGAEYYREWYETGTFQNLFRDFEGEGSVLGERLSNNEQDRNYSNFFAQTNFEITDRLILEAGFNFNTTQYSLLDLFVQNSVNQSGDYRFDSVFSPRIAATYEVDTFKNIYASISHGFSTPTVAETLTPEGQINTDLKPETGVNYEVGFKGSWLNNKLYTEVALFTIQINDLLVAERVAEDQYVGINAGKTSHNGAEVFINYNFSPAGATIVIKPYLNAAVNNFKFREFLNRDMDFSGNNLPGVPANTLNVGAEIRLFNNLSIMPNFLAVGEIPLNDENSLYSNSYQLLNVRANYNLSIFNKVNLLFTAGVNNLLDEAYAASVLPNAVGFGGNSPRYFYPGNPRNYFAGVGLNYNF